MPLAPASGGAVVLSGLNKKAASHETAGVAGIAFRSCGLDARGYRLGRRHFADPMIKRFPSPKRKRPRGRPQGNFRLGLMRAGLCSSVHAERTTRAEAHLRLLQR